MNKKINPELKLSIIIPVYNEEKKISNCLNSLMKQDEKPDEIIVVDNNCIDKTISIVKKYATVKIIQEKKQGMTPARNAGFNKAKYEIITKCDADTILPTDWIKNIKNDFVQNHSIVGISMPVKLVDAPFVGHFTALYYTYMLIPRLMIGVYPMLGPSYAIKKLFWNKIKYFIGLSIPKSIESLEEKSLPA